MDFDFDKERIEGYKNGNLSIDKFKTIDGRHIVIQIRMNKFYVEKKFLNNYDGKIEMDGFLNNIKTEDDVLKYLGVNK